MYHASMQDHSLWRVFLSSKVGLVFVVTFFCVSLSHSFAQVQDVTAPNLVSLVIDTPIIDTSAGPATVRFTVQITDNLSGFDGSDVAFSLRKPSGGGIGAPFCRIIGGTPLQSTQECSAVLPQFSEAGTWSISSLEVRDSAGNFQSLVEGDLRALGFQIDFVNSVGVQDVTSPVITVSATPKTLWPPNGKLVPVTISGTITDAGSGVAPSTATFEVKDEYGLIQPSGQITTLDAKNGSYAFRIQLQASRKDNDADGRKYTIT